MNAITAKMVLQVIGTLAALSCLHFLLLAYIYASHGDWAGLVLVLILGLYFAYLGYLTWLRFSPRAIRHICGATLFWVFLLVRVPIKLVSHDSVITGSLYLLLIAGMVWTYRRAWRYFSSLIFDEHETPNAA
jgi:hypothetical protein